MLNVIITLCSVVYVFGGYHMVPSSLPYLSDVVDSFMILLAIGSYLHLVTPYVLSRQRN